MVFCGQCGLQLAPGTACCMRCGATVEGTNGRAINIHSDDITIAAHLASRNLAGLTQASFPNTQRAYPQPKMQKTSNVRVKVLVFVLPSFLLLLIVVSLFVFHDAIAGITHANSPTTTTIITPTSLSTFSDAQLLGQQIIQRYYDDLNQRNCQDAYNLWNRSQVSVKQFCDGFQDMIHDDVSFGNVTKLSDSMVKVPVTITAFEETQQGGTQQHVYVGYYIIGKQNDNSWKITYGELKIA